MLLVQRYLLTHTFADLERDHGVQISVDSRHGHKFSLNYNQYTSKESDLLACECRGLILSNGSSLNEKASMVAGKYCYDDICPGTTQVICAPMFRFFNYGMGAAKIDWNDLKLKVLEKKDGTLCLLSFDQIINEWHVATRSSPEADINLTGATNLTFRKLFERGLQNTGNVSFIDFCQGLDAQKTYCFELTSPYNRVVVEYPETKLTLLAVRNKQTMWEELPETATEVTRYVPIVGGYPVESVEKIIELVNSWAPSEHEGVILRDSQFNRIKIKSAAYIAAHHAIDNITRSPRSCLTLILSGQADDVLPLLPVEIAKDLIEMQCKIASFIINFTHQYKQLIVATQERKENDPMVGGWAERKIFADEVVRSEIWKSPAYAIFSGKAKSIQDFIEHNKVGGFWSNPFLDNFLELISH